MIDILLTMLYLQPEQMKKIKTLANYSQTWYVPVIQKSQITLWIQMYTKSMKIPVSCTFEWLLIYIHQQTVQTVLFFYFTWRIACRQMTPVNELLNNSWTDITAVVVPESSFPGVGLFKWWISPSLGLIMQFHKAAGMRTELPGVIYSKVSRDSCLRAKHLFMLVEGKKIW